MAEGTDAFVADAALRIEPPRARPRALARHTVATLAALALELGVFALIWSERKPLSAPQVAEIPVEIIVEPPPPPPPPPAPQLKSEEVLKPATDAPRAGNSDHDDEHVADKEKPAAAPPPPAPPTPSPEPSKAAEAPAPDLPQTAEAEAPPPAKADTPPARPSKPTAADVLPKTFASVPDVEFGGEAIKSPVTGGAAKSTYLSQLYGLIVPRLHVPAVAHAYGRRLTGVIGFAVDGRGRLTQRFIVEQSGSLELDEAAMKAVAAASHVFPPPPHGAPVGMKFTYSVE